ncbi:765092d3-2993-4822-bfec-7756b62f6049 [Sclerotinia trifoliorum]|uniref:765092d3-2993-4822-bfec-7756b62f6049 n=1 Tax=Sclerotinia trifoliorum TaxID=28548 RepID=A0A8H2ZN39_9HELO|nr:765092d3-2993-4822-bfec-7756b62f6049 [Sclerotinia trifoliorum]
MSNRSVPNPPVILNYDGHGDEVLPMVWDVYLCGCAISRPKDLTDAPGRPKYKLKGDLCPLRDCAPCKYATEFLSEALNIYRERYMDVLIRDLKHKWEIAKGEDAFVDGDNPPPVKTPFWLLTSIWDQTTLKEFHDGIHDEDVSRGFFLSEVGSRPEDLSSGELESDWISKAVVL